MPCHKSEETQNDSSQAPMQEGALNLLQLARILANAGHADVRQQRAWRNKHRPSKVIRIDRIFVCSTVFATESQAMLNMSCKSMSTHTHTLSSLLPEMVKLSSSVLILIFALGSSNHSVFRSVARRMAQQFSYLFLLEDHEPSKQKTEISTQ